MIDLFKEVLSVVESEVTWLEAAAQHYESFGRDHCDEKPTWDLLAAAYRERASFHQALAEKIRSQAQLLQPDISREQPTRLLAQQTEFPAGAFT